MGLNVWLSYFNDGNSPGLLLGEQHSHFVKVLTYGLTGHTWPSILKSIGGMAIGTGRNVST